MMRARDVAGAAGAGADAGRSLDHRTNHFRVLSHAEIVVGAPDHDVARAARRMPDRVREPAGDALEIRKNPVTPLVMKTAQGGTEILAVIHRKIRQFDAKNAPRRGGCDRFRAFPARLSSRNPTWAGMPAVTRPSTAIT